MDHLWGIAWLGSGVFTVLMLWGAFRTGSPLASIAARWGRWAFLSLSIFWVLDQVILPGYAPGVLLVVSALVWFLVESMVTHIAVISLSRSEWPLFPRFKVAESSEIWPNGTRFIRLRDAIRRHGFKRVQTLVSDLADEIHVRLAIFQNEDKTVQLNVYFIPSLRGTLRVSLALQSETIHGRRAVTDNVGLPFGGFYPDAWWVERRPLMRSFEQLLSRHLARLDAWGDELVPQETDPLTRLNDDQSRIERLNRELGFLHQTADEEIPDRITAPGRYRIWKEIWTLGYLGRSRRY